MTTQLDTVPASKDVTRGAADTWSISFANALVDGETISSAAATLCTAMVGNDGAEVDDFVISATVSTTSVLVSWDGSALTKFSTYRLATTATLNTGAVVELLTIVRCVA